MPVSVCKIYTQLLTDIIEDHAFRIGVAHQKNGEAGAGFAIREIVRSNQPT